MPMIRGLARSPDRRKARASGGGCIKPRTASQDGPKKSKKHLSQEAIILAGYVYVWTTIPSHKVKSAEVLELYRVRWQIELAFKRMKSIMGLGQLPKFSDASSRAWCFTESSLSHCCSNGSWMQRSVLTPGDTDWQPRRSRWREVPGASIAN